MHHPTDRIAHTTAFVTPVWLEREIAQWVDPMKNRSNDPSHHERTLLPRSYISLLANLLCTDICVLSMLLCRYIFTNQYQRLCLHERKEENVLFNDALNTFYLRLYGVRHVVKEHSDSERGNPVS